MNWKTWIAERSRNMDMMDWMVGAMMLLIGVSVLLFTVGSLILLAVSDCPK